MTLKDKIFLKLECVWNFQGYFISMLQISSEMSKGKVNYSHRSSQKVSSESSLPKTGCIF